MNPPPKNKRGKQRSSRDRDHRQDDLHSQKRRRNVCSVAASVPDGLTLCTPVATIDLENPRPNPPGSVEELPSNNNLVQRDLRDIARLNVLTTKKNSGSLSAPVIHHALAMTVGNNDIFTFLSSICVSMDQQLGSRSLNLSAEIGNLPKFRKKAAKKENAILLLALHTLYLNLERAIARRVKITRIDKLFNVKQAFRPLIAVMTIVDGEADQQMEAMGASEAKVLKSLKVDEVEWRRRYMKGSDTELPPPGYGSCPFCGHDFVDSAPVNKGNRAKNQEILREYKEKCAHLQDFRDKRRMDPPLNRAGKEIKKITPPPVHKIQLKCHCHQQRRAVPFSNVQSTCPILCVNQTTQEEYRAGDCPLCNCSCSKTYLLDDVPKIRAELLLQKEGAPKPSSSKQDALEWMGRADKAGALAQTSASESLFGKSPLASISTTSKAAYLKEIFDVSKAKDMLHNLPSSSASTYMQNSVITPLLHDHRRRSVIVIDGQEVDLRTSSSNRFSNNNLIKIDDDESPISISGSATSSSSSSSIIDCTTMKSDHQVKSESDPLIKRMKKRASKFLHPTKRPSSMTETEKEERVAACKVNKLYSAILSEGRAEEEVESIKNSLGEIEFDSQQYNDCFMNIYGYDM